MTLHLPNSSRTRVTATAGSARIPAVAAFARARASRAPFGIARLDRIPRPSAAWPSPQAAPEDPAGRSRTAAHEVSGLERAACARDAACALEAALHARAGDR